MRSRRTILLGLAFGLCGCNIVLDLAQFDGATQARNDGAGSMPDAGTAGSAMDGAPSDAVSERKSDSPSDLTVPDAGAATDAGVGEGEADGAGGSTPDANGPDASESTASDTGAPDAGSADGASNADASGADTSVANPVVAVTWDNPAGGTEGWQANGWETSTNSNLLSCCATQRTATDGVPGDPTLGCLALSLAFTDGTQNINVNMDTPGPVDITGKTLSFYMKLDPSTASSDGLSYLANWFDSNWEYSQTNWAAVPAPALAGQWTLVSFPISSFSHIGTAPGMTNPGIAEHFGIRFATSGGGPFVTTTVYLDSYVIQ